MNKTFITLMIAGLLVVGLIGCEQDDGPVEEAAEAVESAGDAVEDAVD